jgi:hypothetical protein
MPIEFCGCKNRYADEDTVYERPNRYGTCVAVYDQGPTPESLADAIFAGMTGAEIAVAKEYGAGGIEDRIRKAAPNWGRSAISECLDHLNRFCGYKWT